MRGGDVTERMIEANRVELCTEPFGDSTDPAILLLQGVGASMLWWEDGFCRLLADAGRFVIRYDHLSASMHCNRELPPVLPGEFLRRSPSTLRTSGSLRASWSGDLPPTSMFDCR
jgi:hypothetical protein